MLIDRCRGGRTDLIRFLASPLVCQFAKFVAMGGKHVLRLALEDITANQFTVP
jgi:hypothetical protein